MLFLFCILKAIVCKWCFNSCPFACFHLSFCFFAKQFEHQRIVSESFEIKIRLIMATNNVLYQLCVFEHYWWTFLPSIHKIGNNLSWISSPKASPAIARMCWASAIRRCRMPIVNRAATILVVIVANRLRLSVRLWYATCDDCLEMIVCSVHALKRMCCKQKSSIIDSLLFCFFATQLDDGEFNHDRQYCSDWWLDLRRTGGVVCVDSIDRLVRASTQPKAKTRSTRCANSTCYLPHYCLLTRCFWNM